MPGLHRVAHRGYSAVAPENTLPALAAGVLAGAEAASSASAAWAGAVVA